MQSPSNCLDVARLRDYYEQQGDAAREAGDGINCSEKSITDIVVQMAIDHASDFQNVLDVGCGANLIYDETISKLGKQVVGVDFTWNFLKLAPRNSTVSLVQGDALSLPFQSHTFDAVICSETVEHIPDDSAVVSELARVLRPRGWLFFTAPNLWNASRIFEMIKKLDSRVTLMPGHLREYSPKQVSRLLAEDFEIQKVYPVGFGWQGNSLGGRTERLIRQGALARCSKSIAVAARKKVDEG